MTSDNKREITYLEAVREAMVQEMRLDKEVFLIGEDIGTYGGPYPKPRLRALLQAQL
jgi:pyruvate/2-oxoglutarate/acetoin dehydrogenase E1 component